MIVEPEPNVSNNANMGDELEFDSKRLQVGERIYYIDMKENKNGRFIKLVEGLGYGRMSRIVVPLSIASNFIAKLKENNEFSIAHPKSEANLPPVTNEEGDDKNDEFPTIIHSSNLFIQNRRFYFDLREHKDGYRRLRISYVMKTKRINLSMVTDALSNLIDIMEDYVKRFSNGTTGQQNTSIPSTVKVETINSNTTASSVNRSKRTSAVKEEAIFKQPQVKKSSLVVAEKPTPAKHAVINKVYSFEVVTGEQNSFIRITELIGNSKKSTFHVPLEGCAIWKDAIVKFVDEITPEDISKAAALRLAAEAANLTLQAEKAN